MSSTASFLRRKKDEKKPDPLNRTLNAENIPPNPFNYPRNLD